MEQDEVYPPALYIPQRLNSDRGETYEHAALEQVVSWIDDSRGRFVLVLGNPGTGKTFLLRKAALELAARCDHLYPLLLEMRQLEKSHSLNQLVMRQLDERMPAGYRYEKLRYMLDQGRIALLFDGFDELALRVSYERAAEHLDTLLEAARGEFAKVIVTSRTQHFLSDRQVRQRLLERLENSPVIHRIAYLQGFQPGQVLQFLRNFYQGDEERAQRRMDDIRHIDNLGELSENPRMLSFIAKLPDEEMREARSRTGVITPAELYRRIITNWLEGEQRRAYTGSRDDLPIEDRWSAVTELALHLWQTTEAAISLEQMTDRLQRTLRALVDPGVTAFRVGSGTLLRHDNDGNFSFIHQSVLEWLVAKAATDALVQPPAGSEPAGGFPIPSPLAQREISKLMADFFRDLVGEEKAVAWVRATLIGKQASETERKNALTLLEKLPTGTIAQRMIDADPAATGITGWSFAGQALRGHDFSGQDLERADFSGCNLREANFRGANLNGAIFRDANLRDANFTKTDLREADFDLADCTRASFLGANLTGAQLNHAIACFAKLLWADLVGPIAPNSLEIAFGAALHHPATLLPFWDYSLGLVQSVAWSPDGILYAAGCGYLIGLWDAETGRDIRRFEGHQSYVGCVAFSPDGSRILSGSSDKTLRLWETESGREIRRFEGHKDLVISVTFSPDGCRILSGSHDNTLRLWETESGREILYIEGHHKGVESVAFSPDGRHIVSGSYDNSLRLWEANSGHELRHFDGHQKPISSVAFSPDGNCILSGSHDSTIRLWETDSGREIRRFEGQRDWVRAVAFSPDGRRILSGSSSTLCLWETDSGREIRRMGGHQDWVMSVAFTPDSKRLLSSSFGNALRLWDAESGREIRRFESGLLWVESVAISPNGQYIIVAPLFWTAN